MQRLILLLLLTAFIFPSCQNADNFKYEPQTESLTESASADGSYQPRPASNNSQKSKKSNPVNEKAIERKIIRNAQVNMQVENIQEAFPRIERVVKNFDGYISSSNMKNNSRQISNNIVIRVPNESLDTLLRLVERQSIFINNSSISSTDVTEEFIDIESRLKTKKEVRKRYLDILTKKAKTVEDVLLAEEQIRQLTEEIEAKEGRLRYLSNRVGLSTLTLSIYQKVKYEAAPKVYEITFLTKIKEAFINGWEIVLGILLGLVNIWPLIILFSVLFWKRKSIWGKIRRK